MLVKLKQWWNSSTLFKMTIGLSLGAGLGFSYYYFIGCNTGNCAITGSPINSTLYGALMGVVISYPGKRKVGKK